MIAKHEIFEQLGIEPRSSGAFAGRWLETGGSDLTVLDPTTGEPMGQVVKSSAEDYETVVANSAETFLRWRELPAPRRGEYVRRIADELRENKEALGALVAWEMGKIRAEGEGEVQEMIDIADFAVGLSRQLYGLTMHSERPRHRMYEQWHPLGSGRDHHAPSTSRWRSGRGTRCSPRCAATR